MGYEGWLSLRYLFAKRRERFISLSALLSVGGVALGVAVLLVALAIMSGLHTGLKDRFVGINTHLIVEAPAGVHEPLEVINAVSSLDHVVGASAFVVGQAIIRLPDRVYGVVVRGIDPQREDRVSRLGEYLYTGHLPAKENEIALGKELAAILDVWPGEMLALMSPADGKLHDMVVSGLFHSGMYEFDTTLAVVTVPKAQALYQLGDAVSGVGVRLDDMEFAPQVGAVVQSLLPFPYAVRLWRDLNPALFDALQFEKHMYAILFTLIVIVAGANIVSTLVMMITEKTKDIGILKSMGATDASICKLFILQGLTIGGLGIVIGAVLAGLIISWQDKYRLINLPGAVFYMDYLPVRVEWQDWAVTLGVAFAITLLSALYPALKAARLLPVEALRYE
jgi:lipoprotein-releasing system permease protein